jgi:hypothetical protein
VDVGLDGVQRDVQLLADLTSGETAGEAVQYGELGRAGLLDELTVFGFGSGRVEVLRQRSSNEPLARSR